MSKLFGWNQCMEMNLKVSSNLKKLTWEFARNWFGIFETFKCQQTKYTAISLVKYNYWNSRLFKRHLLESKQVQYCFDSIKSHLCQLIWLTLPSLVLFLSGNRAVDKSSHRKLNSWNSIIYMPIWGLNTIEINFFVKSENAYHWRANQHPQRHGVFRGK